MTDWAEVLVELDTPATVRAAYDAALDRLAAGAGPFTVADGLNTVLLAGKFKAWVWPTLTADERASYLERVQNAAQANRRWLDARRACPRCSYGEPAQHTCDEGQRHRYHVEHRGVHGQD